ncbi:pesticin immunity protein [Sphingomonas aracearum]|uniref:Pesticin immunity protein n=1 Tax=Sphingomonas aracearum TaxID=2283317 RepID=A0A369W092_9SPHN|nr:pesticin immunity protein [Sphingomonas aracearum]RDE07305.1 pesticin immunity protein [Sphingomonas aracearum]
MRMMVLAAWAALVAAGASMAAPTGGEQVQQVIRRLDLTSFPNSVGPRRLPGKATFADYGFVRIRKAGRGASLFREDESWMMRFDVISAGPRFLRLCFRDKGLARPGDASAPSYNATSALLVSMSRKGLWTARQVKAGFANCKNDPAAV